MDSSQDDQLFNDANLEALLSHLPDSALSAQIVDALRSASSEVDARGRIEGLMRSRLESVRGELDAKTPLA